MKGVGAVSLATLAIALALPQYAYAKTATDDSVCIHFADTTATVHLELERGPIIGGSLPVTICDLVAGSRYRLRTSGVHLETRIGKLSVSETGAAEIAGIRLGAAVRNIVPPGWGTYYTEKLAVGVTDFLEIATSAYLLIVEHQEYEHLKNRHTVWMQKLIEAETLEDKTYYDVQAREAAALANVQNEHRKRLLIFTGYLYGHQIIDPWLISNPPASITDAGGRVVWISPHGASRPKAFLYSLLRPGRGQFYQGKRTRGVLMSTLSVAAALITLDYQNRYDVEARRYELAVEYFNAAERIEEKKYYAREAESIWEGVKKEKRYRNISLASLLGIWGWSLIDTLFLVDEGTPPPADYSLDVSPTHVALMIRF